MNGELVYLLRALDGSGLHKIGRTNALDSRLQSISREMRPAEVVHVIRTADGRSLEKWLHRLLAHRRVEGEWFDLSRQDVLDIKRIQRDPLYAPESSAPATELLPPDMRAEVEDRFAAFIAPYLTEPYV